MVSTFIDHPLMQDISKELKTKIKVVKNFKYKPILGVRYQRECREVQYVSHGE
jgi:hypothetical protein